MDYNIIMDTTNLYELYHRFHTLEFQCSGSTIGLLQGVTVIPVSIFQNVLLKNEQCVIAQCSLVLKYYIPKMIEVGP